MAFDRAAGFGRDAPGLWISKSSEPRYSVHLALSSSDRPAVQAFYNAALAAGGKDNGRFPTKAALFEAMVEDFWAVPPPCPEKAPSEDPAVGLRKWA
jgi:hypothetical protein